MGEGSRVSESGTMSESSKSVSESSSVVSSGVRAGVSGDVSCFQVGYLRCVYDATVVR